VGGSSVQFSSHCGVTASAVSKPLTPLVVQQVEVVIESRGEHLLSEKHGKQFD